MRARVLILLISLTLAGVALPATGDDSIALSFLRPAGDLDGDGLRDVVGSAWGGFSDVVVEARRGFDGALLWRKDHTSNEGSPFPARLGPEGADSVLLIGSGSVTTPTAMVIRMNFTGLAADGSQLWQNSVSGNQSSGPSGFVRDGVPNQWFLFDATRRPAQDVLVERRSYQELVGGASLNRVEAVVISGETGRTIARAAGEWTPNSVDTEPTGDMSGDGLDDFLLLNGSITTLEINARHGRTGHDLWTATVPIPGDCSGVEDVGDLNGDRRDELAAWTGCDAPLGSVYLLDGASGATLWSGSEKLPAALGDVDGDGRVEFATATEETTATEWAVYHAARHADGSLVYRRRTAVPRTPDVPNGLHLQVDAVGDADEDGIPDRRHVLKADASPSGYAEHRSVVSGRTGASLWTQPREPRLVEAPLLASVDGSGDDMALAIVSNGSYAVRALDGRTGDAIWQTPVLGAMKFVVDFRAADLDGDGRSEIIAESPHVEASLRHTFVLAGTDGHLLWYS